MGFKKQPLLLLLLTTTSLLITIFPTPATSETFKCSSTNTTTCQALVDYVTPNATTLKAIQDLFTVKNLRTILGANGFQPSTLSNTSVQAKQTLKISFQCTCINGTGISNKKPVYTVQPGDGLDHIAKDVFSALMTFKQIAAVNGIPNPDLIEVNQKLWIPLPCSCDEVAGKKVVHYGHVVEAGSNLEGLAERYGTTKEVLMELNPGANDTSLMAGQVLDVPLQG